jgi:hypothetical protein
MTYRFDWSPPGRDFVGVYGWQTIPEMAKGMFESSLYGKAG